MANKLIQFSDGTDNLYPKADGWSSPEILATETFGTLLGMYNPVIKMATLTWRGNGTTATAGLYQYTLPVDYKALYTCAVPVRNGNFLEVNGQGLNLSLLAYAWSSATLTYPTA